MSPLVLDLSLTEMVESSETGVSRHRNRSRHRQAFPGACADDLRAANADFTSPGPIKTASTRPVFPGKRYMNKPALTAVRNRFARNLSALAESFW